MNFGYQGRAGVDVGIDLAGQEAEAELGEAAKGGANVQADAIPSDVVAGDTVVTLEDAEWCLAEVDVGRDEAGPRAIEGLTGFIGSPRTVPTKQAFSLRRRTESGRRC